MKKWIFLISFLTTWSTYAKKIHLIDKNSFIDTNSGSIEPGNSLRSYHRNNQVRLPFNSSSKIAYSVDVVKNDNSNHLTEGFLDASLEIGKTPSYIFMNHRTRNRNHEMTTSCKGENSNQKVNFSCLSVNNKICQSTYNYISKLGSTEDFVNLSKAAKTCVNMEQGVLSDLQDLMTEDSYYKSLNQERTTVGNYYKKMKDDKGFVNDGVRFFPNMGEIKSQIIGKNKVKEVVSFGRGGQESNESFSNKFSLFLETLDLCRHSFPPSQNSQFWRPIFEELPKIQEASASKNIKNQITN